ncbi:MAG: hypothetical protein M1837_002022 [Sclerophora amabilis]|nr:MAG: hypothetical protein M1837_002022 [Sclerophora amabilis]
MHLSSVALLGAFISGVVGAPSPSNVAPRQYGSGGKTFVNIGQNYHSEWAGFEQNIKTPAGISLYGGIYEGALNPESQDLLKRYAAEHSGYVVIGLSWKDAMMMHGYTQYQGAQLCRDISGGKFDAELEKLSAYLAKYPNVKYLLRPDYEVSGNLHANTDANTFNQQTMDWEAYPAAFRHIRSKLKSCGNIQYVFHTVRGEAEKLYPGDEYVDFIGLSIFNNDVCVPVASTINCPDAIEDPNIVKDIKWAPKPVLIAESTVQPPFAGSAEQFIEYLTRVKQLIVKHDIVGWTYINSLWTAHGWTGDTWGDSRIEASEQVKQWFMNEIVGDERFVFG